MPRRSDSAPLLIIASVLLLERATQAADTCCSDCILDGSCCMYGAGFCFATKTCLGETPSNQCWDDTKKPSKCADENGACGQTVADCEVHCESLGSCDACAADASCYWCLDSNACHAGGCSSSKDPGIRCPGHDVKGDPSKCAGGASASATQTATASATGTGAAKPTVVIATATATATASSTATFTKPTVVIATGSATATASSTATFASIAPGATQSATTSATASATASASASVKAPAIPTPTAAAQGAASISPSLSPAATGAIGGVTSLALLILAYCVHRLCCKPSKPSKEGHELMLLRSERAETDELDEALEGWLSLGSEFPVFCTLHENIKATRKANTNAHYLLRLTKAIKKVALNLTYCTDHIDGFKARHGAMLDELREALLGVNDGLMALLKAEASPFAGYLGARSADKNAAEIKGLELRINEQQRWLDSLVTQSTLEAVTRRGAAALPPAGRRAAGGPHEAIGGRGQALAHGSEEGR